MPLLADLFQIAILVTCLIGLGLASKRLLPEIPFALHFCFAPLAFTGVLFCFEHYFPLGQMPWLWIPAFAYSLWLMGRAGKTLLREPVLWFFILGFSVCLFWRFSYPDIYDISEMLPDMDHLVSYSTGGHLPAEDVWMKGTKDDSYYIFQYYAAGLIHRFIGCGPGLTYQLGYCVVVAMGVAGTGAGVQAATRSFGAGLWAGIVTALGGNGTTLLTPFMSSHFLPSPLLAMRFTGSYAMPTTPGITPFGLELIHFLGASKVDAPMEYYSYIIMLGDFHPSLSSLAFFGLAILAIGTAESAQPGSKTDKFCVTAAIATAVFILVSNTWILPLQVALVVCWLVYRWWIGRGDSWIHILASVLGCVILILPYFSYFAYESRYYPIHFEWVKERPPLLDWLAVMLPAFLMWLVCLRAARTDSFALFTVTVGIGALLGTYFFYIHDIYGGDAAVFNTTLKWWPWTYALVLMLGLISVWRNLVLRRLGLIVMVLTLVGNLWIFSTYWWNNSHPHMGRLDGYAWFTDNTEQNAIYQQLQTMPRGVVLESSTPNSADTGTSLALFTGHYSLGGWTGHEILWREGREDIARLAENRDKFYTGKLENPASWLRAAVPGGVDYIVWINKDNDRGLDIWPVINDAIKEDYDWRSTFDYNKGHWGMWVRKTRP
ncbi:MAG: DUF2298 domain-containing protein [Methylacidiphilales bacterium]|nr:DUF2298 domain-containing protein [Candidatus Methylacidiphilales bacterium]